MIIADGDPLVRRVLRPALRDDGFVVIAETATVRETTEMALHYRPDLLVVDSHLPGGDVFAVLDRLGAARAHNVRVVVLAIEDDPAQALRALEAGAVGWVSKDVAVADLVRGLRGAMRGEAVTSRRFIRRVIDRLREGRDPGPGQRPVRSPLTAREWEVYEGLCAGQPIDTIASDLELAPATVRGHVKRILRKLGVHSREEAVAMAPRVRSTG